MFIKQTRKDDCGVIAIVNLHRWLKVKAKWGDIAKSLKYKKEFGVNQKYLSKYLLYDVGHLPIISVEELQLPTVSDLKKAIKQKKLVILGADQLDNGVAHIGIVSAINKNYATLVNWGGKSVRRRVSLKTFRIFLDQSFCVAYFVKKLEL